MFAYCDNSPVINLDAIGESPVSMLIGTIVALVGIVNNFVSMYQYETSDGQSELTSSSYSSGDSISKQEKIDYTKQQTGEEHYNINAWRYYSEYTLHECGWYISGWAYEQDVPVFSEVAARSKDANLSKDEWDNRWFVKVGTVFIGILGF